MSVDSVARQFAGLNASAADPVRPYVDSSPTNNAAWEGLVLAAQDMPRFQWALCCWMWAGWDHMMPEVAANIEAKARGAIDRGKKRNRFKLAEQMAGLVMLELSDDHCRACAGRGATMDKQGLVSDCPACAGHGLKGMSGRERARWLGLSESTYRESVKEIYDHVFEWVRRQRDEAVAHVQARKYRAE